MAARVASPRRLIASEPLEIRAAFVPDSFRMAEGGHATVDIVASAGAAVLRRGWFEEGPEEFDERLSFDEGAHRDGRLLSGRTPLLLDHRAHDARAIIGVLSNPRWDRKARTLTVTARLSRSEADRDVVQKIQDGLLANPSIGYRTFTARDVTRKGDARRQIEAVDWEIHEVSLTAVPADAGAHVRSIDQDLRSFVVTRESDPMDPETLSTSASVTPPAPGIEIRTATIPAAPAQVASPAPVPAPTLDAAASAAADAEAQRQRTIRERLQAAGLGADAELSRALLDDRAVTPDVASTRILARLAGTQRSSEVAGLVHTGTSEAERLARAVEAAILYRVGQEHLIDGVRRGDRESLRAALQGNPYLHRSTMETGSDYVARIHGFRSDHLPKMERAGAILQQRAAMLSRDIGGGHSTSDFPQILANVMSKVLRQAYELAPDTYSQWTRRGTLPDFKTAKRVQIGAAPKLLKTVEGAEYKSATVGEMGESILLATYGRIIGFTRQAMVNDDLDAFGRIPAQFGASARQLVADLVYVHLTANTVMGDSVALFATGHGNLITAAGNGLGITGLSNIRTLARKQLTITPNLAGETGHYMSVALRHLRVPPELETVAQQLTGLIQPALVTSVNPFQGVFSSVMAEPRLTDATAYFLFADPSELDTIEVAFLQGEEGPQTETRMGFERDGLEMKVRLDVGTSPIEFRGCYKNAGTA